MTPGVIILGGGGHARVLIDALQLQPAKILGITDPGLGTNNQRNVPILGDDNVVFCYDPASVHLINGLGSVGRSLRRIELFVQFKTKGYTFASVIHPATVLAKDVQIGEGVQLMAGAIVQTGSTIGNNSIVNTRASIDHDCTIGNHVHIAPGVTVSGGVKIGNCSHIGTGANVIQGVTIGKNCLVGAGALVINDVPDGSQVLGVPARAVEK